MGKESQVSKRRAGRLLVAHTPLRVESDGRRPKTQRGVLSRREEGDGCEAMPGGFAQC